MGRVMMAAMSVAALACDPLEARPGGAPCAVDVQCADGLCTPATLGGHPTGFSGGMCTQPCAAGGLACQDVGFQCVPMATGSLCLPECDEADDCREGYVCADVGTSSTVCLPDCRRGFACLTGLCDAATGQCVPPGAAWEDVAPAIEPAAIEEPVSTEPLFAPCSPDGGCDGGQVCAGPHRTCHLPCGLGEPACPSSTGCGPTPLGPLCLPLCDETHPCPTGLSCAPSPVPPPAGADRPWVCLKTHPGPMPVDPTPSNP